MILTHRFWVIHLRYKRGSDPWAIDSLPLTLGPDPPVRTWALALTHLCSDYSAISHLQHPQVAGWQQVSLPCSLSATRPQPQPLQTQSHASDNPLGVALLTHCSAMPTGPSYQCPLLTLIDMTSPALLGWLKLCWMKRNFYTVLFLLHPWAPNLCRCVVGESEVDFEIDHILGTQYLWPQKVQEKTWLEDVFYIYTIKFHMVNLP